MKKPQVSRIATFPEVEKLHQLGVSAAVKGDIEQAAERYEEALGLTFDLEDPTRFNAGAELHQARIIRDRGFLDTHAHASAPDTPFSIEAGMADLKESLGITSGILACKGVFDEKSVQRVNAEHGATITCQARILVYQSLITNELPDETAEQIRGYFNQAKETLWKGNSSYYGASNAMRAAAFERILGHEQMRGWLADAAGFVATPHGVRDFARACRTTGSIGFALSWEEDTTEVLLQRP